MQILKGAPVAAAIRDEIKKELEECETKPCLAIVRVGEKQEDLSYERSALKRMSGVGIETKLFVFPADISMDDFSAKFAAINDDPTIDGILLFHPLPSQLNESQIVESIAPEKDVDGISSAALGKLFSGDKHAFAPCTAQAVMEILHFYGIEPQGKRAVVLGRSLVVGKPLSMLLLNENATVTICHSRTASLPEVCREADILVTAIGKAKWVDERFVSEKTIVIDVGINVDENGMLCGDVNFGQIEDKVSMATPVPGGVGAVTTAVLAKHVLEAAKGRRALNSKGGKMGFLPINRREMQRLGWEQPDFVYVTGDAYVDHPSFGHAIISRILESHGYKVAILPQPDWRDDNAIHEFGKPRLGFLVSSGNMDSMVNHYSVSKKRRQMDAYTPGGVIGKRPDYADVVYGNYIRRNFPDSPIILGGIEASLRRLAHYDYWSDKLKRSILIEAQADIISYGMGEHSIVEIADALNSGLPVSELTFIRGTVCKVRSLDRVPDALVLPTYDELTKDKKQYAASFYKQYCNTDPFTAKQLAEPYGSHLYVIQNPPAYPLTTQEMDDVYELPYMRTYHPSYEALGGVPAISEIKFSLCSNRGCFGGCSFCALTFHQGRIIQTRSHESLIREAKLMTQEKDFKGYIHDVGGPTANFRHPACQKQLTKGVCTGKQCLFPSPCKNLTVDHQDYIQLLRKLRALPKVKKVFIRSGIRFDYVLADKSDAFLKELCQYHVSGQLKVAPEHVSDRVLKYMGKPENAVYKRFTQRYKAMNEKLGLKQYLVPYLMSSHPGSQLTDAVEMAEHLRDLGYMPEQVQDFYPTPSTISTCMYYTGIDPRTGESVYIPKDPHEKAMQRALIQYRDPKLYDLVKEALIKCGRQDLIGFGKECLIAPRNIKQGRNTNTQHAKKHNDSSNTRQHRSDSKGRYSAGKRRK